MKTLAGRKQCNHCGAPIRDVITEGTSSCRLFTYKQHNCIKDINVTGKSLMAK